MLVSQLECIVLLGIVSFRITGGCGKCGCDDEDEDDFEFGDHPVPYALSPVYLKYLEKWEGEFYRLLKDRLLDGNNTEKERYISQRYLTEYEHSVQNRTTGSTRKRPVSANPILAMQMINRFVKYSKNNLFKFTQTKLVDENFLPGQKDAEDAMEALLRLQYIYDLDALQLSNGILDGTQTTAQLSARECFQLGKFAQDSAYFTLALQWFDTALQKLKNDKSGAEIGLTDRIIMTAIKDTIEEHNDDHDENIIEGDMYSFSSPIYNTNYSAIAHLSLRKSLVKELSGKVLAEKDPRFYQAIEANTITLCDGKNLKSEGEKAKLKCWLDTRRHPYWRINPLKVELLNSKPQIVQLYDVFNNNWIAYLKIMSYSSLERAPQPPEATPRTAAYAWFEDTEIPHAPISKTVEFITGLNVMGTAAAEALQVAAYAFGGHVEPHFDSKGPDDPEPSPRGDRVTTFLVYLNQVEKGGLTAFPLLGFHVKPVKNSAVLWYTNLKNGEVDDRTLHAACPVISGHKWIATKWTHINENILKRPCGLSKFE